MSEALKKNYRVYDELGRGRFGVVYKAYSKISGEPVAVKSINKTQIGDCSLDRKCLYNEAKVMNKLSGVPHILRFFEVYEDENFVHIVLERCNGSDLFGRILSRNVFSEEEAFAVMRPLMEAIAHCHRLGIAHRDIKPENVVFNDQNELKLADFGSAEFFQGDQLMSGVVGTPYYIAPEVVSHRDYNEKIDIWSAGVILYMMLAGFPPFHGQSAKDIFEAVLRANLRFPTQVFRSVSPTAKDLLRKMLTKDVHRRFSAEQVLRHPWMTSRGGGGGGNWPEAVAVCEASRSAAVLS
ncbi:OLC1v1019725C1 [Oldenlandia corymbosa var. corymbosa]|uniref:OLC1v1019725C1 n=1 Tax=Oldenlandia corymbosa var. corymbosa TaxID=529605 RepID=A0AAV1EEK9_OLDCO|nr:OLC1v1019725C1 [Oldenlandia corymbosa var. corymbosa]